MSKLPVCMWLYTCVLLCNSGYLYLVLVTSMKNHYFFVTRHPWLQLFLSKLTVRKVRCRELDLSGSWEREGKFCCCLCCFCCNSRHSFAGLSARSQNQCNGVLDLVFKLVGIHFITTLLPCSNLSVSRFSARWSYNRPFTEMMGFIWINIHLGTRYVPSSADYWTINCQKKEILRKETSVFPRYNVNDPRMYTLRVHYSHFSW